MDQDSPCYKCWHLTSTEQHETITGVINVCICSICYIPSSGQLEIYSGSEPRVRFRHNTDQIDYPSVIKLADPEMLDKLMSVMDESYNKMSEQL